MLPQRSRYIQRLTPVTSTGKATESGVDGVARIVLAPHFHQADQTPKKVCHASADAGGCTLTRSLQFAIRTTIRHHSLLGRDDIIKRVAQAVGPPHVVDLKHYELLILVDVWKVGPTMTTATEALDAALDKVELTRDLS